MMMMGEGMTVPPWSPSHHHHLPVSGGVDDDEMTPYLFTALQQYLPSNDYSAAALDYSTACADADEEEMAAAMDAYASDEFRMYDFKVRRCTRARSHDWTECPFAHPGEKARRRDPRKFHYSGTACPDFRKGGCKRGDACEFAHGVFECWLHPARYRTQPCKDGTACRRRVCFFAHTPDQLRVLPPQQQQQCSPRGGGAAASYDGSPLRRQAFESYLSNTIMSSSPTSTLVSPPKSPPSDSPPLSPDGYRRGGVSWPGVGSPVNDVVASLRHLRLSKANSSPAGGWATGYPSPSAVAAYGSPKGAVGGLYSLPSTPRAETATAMVTSSGFMPNLEPLDVGFGVNEEPVQRVGSGWALRAKMFERLSKEGTAPSSAEAAGGVGGPDVGWVSDLIN